MYILFYFILLYLLLRFVNDYENKQLNILKSNEESKKDNSNLKREINTDISPHETVCPNDTQKSEETNDSQKSDETNDSQKSEETNDSQKMKQMILKIMKKQMIHKTMKNQIIL